MNENYIPYGPEWEKEMSKLKKSELIGQLRKAYKKESPDAGEGKDEVIAAFIKVARHVRNFPHPELPIEKLRSEAVMAEVLAEQVIGNVEYKRLCELAFKES